MDKDLIKQLDDAHRKNYEFSLLATKDIWQNVTEKYLKNTKYNERTFDELLSCVADDYGVYKEQIVERIASTKEMQQVLDKLKQAHNERRKAIMKAKDFVKTVNYPKVIKFFKLNSVWTWIRERNKS
jgi:hypothetical protein